MLKLRADQLAEIMRDVEPEEMGEATPMDAALLMQGRIMLQMMAEIRAGVGRRCAYGFKIKRDDNKMITEIIAVPITDDGKSKEEK